MNILLDTCSFLWIADNSENKLSQKAKELFKDRSNAIMFSVVSAWEISIKWKSGKLRLKRNPDHLISEEIKDNDLTVLPVHLLHTLQVAHLPLVHRDPFDRLLIAQAQIEDYYILSSDQRFDHYEVQRLW